MTAPAGLRSEPVAAAVPAAPATPAPAVLRLATFGFALYAAMLPVGLAPMTIAGVLCVALAIAAAVTLRGAPWLRTPLDVPALVWLAATVVATVFAVDPRASAGSLGKSLMPLVTGLVAWLAIDARRGAAAVAAMLAAGTIAALIGAGRFVAAGAHFPSRAIGLSGSWMTFGVQMMLLASLGAAIALTSRSARWRQGATIAALAALIALAASFTRAAWIGAGVALAVVFGLTRPRALLGLAVVFVAALFIPGDFGDRLRSAFDPAHPMNRERELMWDAGRHILREHPWTGVGLVNLQPFLEPFRSPEAAEHPRHLHDSYLQVAATTGVIGLAAFVMLCTGLMRTVALGLARAARAGGLGAGVRLGVTGGAAGFLVAALFDHTFGDRQLLLMLFTLAGIAWAARGWSDTAG